MRASTVAIVLCGRNLSPGSAAAAGMKRYDVAVIGAGVFGAWTAWHLARAGKSVLLADAWGAGHSRSSSGGETRIIRLGYGADRDLYAHVHALARDVARTH